MKEGGTESMKTQKLSDLFTEERIFFLKIDAEHSEGKAIWIKIQRSHKTLTCFLVPELVIGGFLNYFENRLIQHFVMEVWTNQVGLVVMFYQCGYKCTFFDPNSPDGSNALDKTLWSAEEARGNITAHQGDIYCTWLR